MFRIRSVASVGLFLLLAVSVFAIQALRVTTVAQYRASQRYEDVYYLPPASWLPVLSAGFKSALADLIWCRSLVYFGEELLHRGDVEFVFEYTDAILSLDPDFRAAYEWVVTGALYRPKDVSVSDGMRAVGYLGRALKRWPNDGQLHWKYGAVLRFELAPLIPPGPEKERMIAEATPHLVTAATLGAGPPWLAINSSGLLQRLGKTEQAIRHLEEVYGTVQDDFAKRTIEAELARLRSQSFVEALKATNEDFERSRVTSYPYLSPSLFFLVGNKLSSEWPEQVARRFLSTPEMFEDPDDGAHDLLP